MRQATTVQMTLRVPISTIARIDDLAERAGLARAQVVRMLLRRASEAELPSGLVENAACLREARGVAQLTTRAPPSPRCGSPGRRGPSRSLAYDDP